MAEEIIGDYKIEPSFMPGYGRVKKALGPWPLRNWSWISFYDGTVDQCREYIRWVERVDAGDRTLIDHAADWWMVRFRVPTSERPKCTIRESVEHLPKMSGYDFAVALAMFPKQAPPETEVSVELLFFFIAIPMILILGFIYHSN